jgi:eukaryotic-like serine/threonine-protein kinase
METIHLPNGSWSYDPSDVLGKGGFGTVFGGRSDEHGPIAVKALTSLRDERELRIAKELSCRELRFVLPVLDCGLDADGTSNYIIMPRADHSLATELDRRVALPPAEAAIVLLDILSGLEELPDLVHRDLKPGNVLMHDGRWKLADFGLAKQLGDATSTNTMRTHRSRPYAAPEQWREERPTSATDIYALGCIAFELVEGRRAFPGNDYRQQHLESDPPIPASVPFQLPVSMMLRKPPTSRVNTVRLRKLLEEIKKRGDDDDTAPEPQQRLRSISVSIEQSSAAAEAAAMQAEEASVRRGALVKVAREVLEDITDRLFDKIMTAAPQARIDRPMQSGRRNISLNNNCPTPSPQRAES